MKNYKNSPILETGLISLKETTSPSEISGFGQFYNKSNGQPYYLNGSGNEYNLVGIKWSVISTTANLVTNNSYFCDTSTAGFTVTMPASPAIGDTIWINDLATTFAIAGKELTINFNSKKHQGVTGDYVASSSVDEMMCWVYSNSTYGWKRVVK